MGAASRLKPVVKALVPPALLARLRPKLIYFEGDYARWEDAVADSDGYEAEAIVQAAVRSAEHPDDEICPLAAEVLTAIQCTGLTRLRVLDVGGASGHYFRKLKRALDLDWTVVETPAMVAALQRFATPGLRFSTEPEGNYDLVLMSGVVQYVPDPYAMIGRYAWLAPHIIFNRVPLTDRDRLTVQHIRGGVGYIGSYPAWFLSEERFLDDLPGEPAMRWETAGDVVELDGKAVQCRGMLVNVPR